MADRKDVEAKLKEVESWVRTAFEMLGRAGLGPDVHFIDESGPGRRFVGPDGRWICRVHPKIGHIAVGFPNARRQEVEATGRLRSQREATWITMEDASMLPTALGLIGVC